MMGTVSIPLEVNWLECPHCHMEFAVMFRWIDEDVYKVRDDFVWQDVDICPYCGKKMK